MEEDWVRNFKQSMDKWLAPLVRALSAPAPQGQLHMRIRLQLETDPVSPEMKSKYAGDPSSSGGSESSPHVEDQ